MIEVREYKELYVSWKLQIRLYDNRVEVIMIDQPDWCLAELVIRYSMSAKTVKQLVEELQKWLKGRADA